MSKKAIVCVSFGSSYENTVEKTIKKIEEDFAKEFSGFEIRRAFTSSMIIGVLKKRGIETDNLPLALEKLEKEGFNEVYVQPTHFIAGHEYEKLKKQADEFKNKFDVLKVGVPLLFDEKDIENVCKITAEEISPSEDEALVLMGHGTDHSVNYVYTKTDEMFKKLGCKNIFVGTVEALPDIGSVINMVEEKGFKKAVLSPFMLVCGDHANNDMWGDEDDSWKNSFIKKGFETRVVLKGMGEYENIRKIIVSHAHKYLGM